ncbi:Protein sel-1-like protein 3 [Frankliniella fusca]|uniref:Protein sel-1-like protein 3 n=1 Tax=Frankliniella fusca TaxID=407009 RepID=A0AAE1LKK9_9NEOP|nr:Protein sel-1-like protein 3 [Frankliniella fusca]
MLGLLAAARRRHALADVLECFRVYGAQLPPGLRGTATTLALAFVVPFHMVLYACDAMAFIPESLARYGVKSVVMSTAFFHLQQVQWSVAFVLMLYPMVVVGSLSADLRRDCSRTAELRLRQSTSSPDKEGLGPHELIVLVVLCALVSPSLHLSHSLVEITRSSSSRTALVSAITGIVYLLNFAMLSLCCQLFFFESGAMAQVLQGFLVENGSLNGQETQELTGFSREWDIKKNKRELALGTVSTVLLQMLAQLTVARRRHTLADVLECLRLYGARLPLGPWGAAATLALTSVIPLQMVGPSYFRFRMGVQTQLVRRGAFQFLISFVLMLYPMVVVGSLSADLRRDCSRTAARRLRQSSSSTDNEGFGPHDTNLGERVWRELRLRQHMLYDMCITNVTVHQEFILLVVLNTLVSPSLYLAHSLLEITQSRASRTALVSAISGIVHFLNFVVLSLCCQRFFFESGTMTQILQSFLVLTGSQSDESQEVCGMNCRDVLVP